MKRSLVNILILVLLLAGLLMVGEGVSRAVQNSNDGISHYFVTDPNDPESEAVLDDCQIIYPSASSGQVLSEDSDDKDEDADEDKDNDENDDEDVE